MKERIENFMIGLVYLIGIVLCFSFALYFLINLFTQPAGIPVRIVNQ